LYEMSQAIDVAPTYLCRVELGKRLIKAEYIPAISEYLGIPAEELVVKE